MRSRLRLRRLLAGAGALAVLSCGSPSPSPSEQSGAAAKSDPMPSSPPPQWPSWGGVPWPSTADETLAAGLRQAQLDRDPQAEAIERAWQHSDAGWRARSLWTLARIGGSVARQTVFDRLADGRIEWSAPMLAAVAFLEAPSADAGLRSDDWDRLEDRLWTRYAVTDDAAQADALLLAIARVGGERSPRRLAADLAVLPQSDDEQQRHAHGMDALSILCARGYALGTDALGAVALGLTSPHAEPRRAAAHALSRCAVVSAEQLAGDERGTLVERLAPLASGDDPEAARMAWRALEGLGSLPTVTPGWVLGPSASASDWMAEVAAVRALAGHADGRTVIAKRLPQIDLANFTGPRLHVLRELLERLRPYAVNDAALHRPLEGLRAALSAARAGAQERRTKALTLIACEVEVLLATRSGSLDALARCAQDSSSIPAEHAEALAVEALVHMGAALPREQRIDALVQRAADPRARVAAPALGALAGIDDARVNPALRAGLARDDMGIAAAAAGAVGRRATDESRRDPGAISALLSVVERFDNAHAVETRVAAIDALGRLARSESSKPTPKPGEGEGESAAGPTWLDRMVVLASDPAVAVRAAARRALRGEVDRLEIFDAGVPVAAPSGFAPPVHEATDRLVGAVAGLRLHTDAGVITIDTTGAPAPIAQANIGALAEAGFFDGLTFHRVVPGFVIQGGDPRGDGYGGPGHVMPCEWSNLRYRRGTVGIALAGKDTGGSQLFIAHDRPHHLDGRYTVIGQVIDGMDVVDAIWPYDRITRVERLDQAPAAAGADDGSAP